MKELELIKERLSVPSDFLTTVTINTFRPQYYFSKKQAVELAVSVHRKYRESPEYRDYVFKTLPLMLDSHKILAAINLYDMGYPNSDIIEILNQTRTDHIPDFWLTLIKYHKELGLLKTGSGRRARNLVWKFLNFIAETRGSRTVAFWFIKNKAQWNEVAYRTHTHFKDDLECLAGGLLFGRTEKLGRLQDEGVKAYLKDLETITDKVRNHTLTLRDLAESNLPFRTLEGFASKIIDTKSLEFYRVAFDKMTYYEALRRTGAMLRNGFLDEYHDLWFNKMRRAARRIDPVEIGSVILQHPELSQDLREILTISLEETGRLKFPRKSVVLCDASRSMKMKKTNPAPRVTWELIGLAASAEKAPSYFVRDVAERVPEVTGARGISREFGNNEAFNPTSLSRGLEEAKKHDAEYVFLISDCQSNIPYRGHEKIIAKKMKSTIITMNPTINPLEPEAATRLNTPNEVFLPIRGLRFLKKLVEVII